MKFKELIEAVTATKRVGIQHLHAIKPLDFIKMLKLIQTKYNGIVDKSSANVSEKIDGSSLKIGNSNGKFYAESSYVGPIFKTGGFLNHVSKKYPNNSEEQNKYPNGFDDILEHLRNSKQLQQVLKPYKDIKIQFEMLYNPFGVINKNKIRFVGIEYDTDKLGKIATFIILNIMDGDGNTHPDSDKIKEQLANISTKELIFDDTSINYGSVDITVEINKFQDLIKNYDDVEYIIKSRKHADRDAKNALKEIIAQYQIKIGDKLLKGIKKGKFGPDVEGLVFQLGEGEMFKVVSSKFKDGKVAFDKQNKKDKLKK